MAYVGMAVGVLWMAILFIVLAMCRASGRADAARELVDNAAVRPSEPIRAASDARPGRAAGRAVGAGARRDAPPVIAMAAAAAGARPFGR